jgi:hypothetical protein
VKRKILFTPVTCALALTATGRAEQGGNAHYLPGSEASFIDAFPGKPGALAVLNYFPYYDAGPPANQQLPLGGFLTAGIDATVYADTIEAFYQAPWNVLGGELAVGVAVPDVWLALDAQAQAQGIGPGGERRDQFSAPVTARTVLVT